MTAEIDVYRTIWAKPDYKEPLFNKVIEMFVSKLIRRFSEEASTILTSMSTLLTGLQNYLDSGVLKAFVDHYNLRDYLMKGECDVFAVQFSNSAPGCKTSWKFCNSSSHIAYALDNFIRHTKFGACSEPQNRIQQADVELYGESNDVKMGPSF